MQITVQLCGRNVQELQKNFERILNYGMRLILSQLPRTPGGDMRHTLYWMPLERWRTMLCLVLMHRCINQLAPACLNKSVQRDCILGYAGTTYGTPYGTRGSDNPHLFPVNSERGKHSFVFRASLEWATLPSEIRGI